eukprot:Rmarinus@m.27620
MLSPRTLLNFTKGKLRWTTKYSVRSAINSDPKEVHSLLKGPMKYVTSTAIGFLAGAAGSMVGLGGGFVMVPAMESLGISVHSATATSLVAVTTTAMGASFSYIDACCVDVPAAASLAISAMVGARYGAGRVASIPGHTLKQYLGTMMVVASPLVPLRSYFQTAVSDASDADVDADAADVADVDSITTLPGKVDDNKICYVPSTADSELSQPPSRKALRLADIGDGIRNIRFVDMVEFAKSHAHYVVAGALTGVLSGMFGIGGGLFMTGYLVIPVGMPHHTALGTALLAMVPSSVVGAFTRYRAGQVALGVAPGLAFGALLGANVGGKAAIETDPLLLQSLFSLVLLLSGVHMFRKGRIESIQSIRALRKGKANP